jgi:anti-sigma factor RsiW
MMRDCEDGAMRDLLPDYVHGTLSARDREMVADHLEACADCAPEVELIRTASSAFPAPVVDVGAIVKALPAAPRAGGRGSSGRQVWRIAAGIGVVAIGGLSVIALRGLFSSGVERVPQVATTQSPGAAVTPPATTPVQPRGDTSTVKPQAAVASAASSKTTGRSLSFGGGLSDLSDDQLGALLSELNGLESLPAAEPETHLVTIVPPGEGGQGAR